MESVQQLSSEAPSEEPTTPPATDLARNAGLLALGAAASRVLGLAREMVIAYLFGATGAVSAFRVAVQAPTMLYDLLVGGMLSAALVPVLSETLHRRSRADFMRLVSALFSLFAVLLAGLLLLLAWAAPAVAWLLAGGLEQFDPTLLPLTVQLMRLVAPAVWLAGMAGVVMAALYALQRFTFPSAATAVYNLGVIIAAPLLAPRLGVAALAVGVLLGNLAQLALMSWDLLRAGVRPRWSVEWRNPALGKMLLLYGPIAAGMVVSMFQIALDRRLASGAGEQSIAWMANATTLQQMPLGLISVAISLAALPRLSQHHAVGDLDAYRHTLARGLQMVLLFIIPAAVGLWLLGEPVVRLLFQRGSFTAADTVQVAAALNIYLLGMLFAAVDFPLNFAFYARNTTLLPALVGVLSVGIYVMVAFALIDLLGFLGLVWADTAKQAGHALVMFVLLTQKVGGVRLNAGNGLVRVLAAGGLMGAAMALAARWLAAPLAQSGWELALTVALVGGLGLLVYVAVLYLLGDDEVRRRAGQARGRLRLR